MIAALSSERRRCSELPSLHHPPQHHHHCQQHHHHYFQQPFQPKENTAIGFAAEGARMISPQMTPPRLESSRRRATELQIFLCLLGCVLSASVSFWMAVFSKDTLLRRATISSIAAMCALIFALLAYVAFKKRKRKPIDDIEISQSILREHRKSMTNSLRKSTAHSDEFLQQIRRHSSVIAVDSARQQLLAVHQAPATKTGSNLLSVDSPQKATSKRATSTCN